LNHSPEIKNHKMGKAVVVIFGDGGIVRNREKEVPGNLVFFWISHNSRGRRKEPFEMSSLRQDSLTGRWVIVAPRRHGRPNEFRAGPSRKPERISRPENCPFCPGQEHKTPPEVLATERPVSASADSPGWRVRVVPNLYPAVRTSPDETGLGPTSNLFPNGPAQGGHEVVVCCPGHDEDLGDLAVDHLAEIFTAVRRRVAVLGQENLSSRYVLVFGNKGPESGATLSHPHLQIISTPVVPALVVDKVEHFVEHHRAGGSCLLCESLAEEKAAGTRIIAENETWVALAPWASRFAGEMRLIPRAHGPGLPDASEKELTGLAELMGLCLRRLNHFAPGADYNLVIHSAPLAADGRSGYGNERLDQICTDCADMKDVFHWHVEILPRLSRLAGFEAGTGFAINSLPPEEAAANLRQEGF
jgi:UDPglucose--hexose-1-phosphate uridylyltransferase